MPDKLDFAERQISSVETKSGVLLTHISMMIAITGLMLAVSESSFGFELVLAAELIFYLLLALASIRCQYQFDNKNYSLFQPTDPARSRSHMYQRALFGELIYREWLFRKTHRSLYFLTFLLLGTVVFGLFADEFGLLDGESP